MSFDKAKLSKFLKLTKLVILSIEDDSSENTVIHKLTLAEPITAVGSNVTDTGAEMRLPGVKTVYVAGEDFDAMLADCTEVGEELHYEGKLKVDVSRPKGRNIGGVFTVTKPANAWLVSVAFNKRGASLQQDNRAALSTAIASIFGSMTDGKFVAPSAVAAAAQKTGGATVVDTNTKLAGAGK